MAPIDSLSVELVIQMANQLGSLADLLAFASSCRRFRAIYEANAWAISHEAISRSIECETQAWILLSAQEGISVSDAKSPSGMTFGMVLRLVRNATKVDKAIGWFNKEEMKFIKPEKVLDIPTHYKCWDSSRRPPRLTKAERRRFRCGYYLAVAITRPTGFRLLDQIPLRYVYYAWEMSKLGIPIGEEGPLPKNTWCDDQRNQLRDACRNRMEQLWEHVYADRELRSRPPVECGMLFGCFHSHLVIYDQYQEQAEYELLNGPTSKYPKVDYTFEELKEHIWGDLSDDET